MKGSALGPVIGVGTSSRRILLQRIIYAKFLQRGIVYTGLNAFTGFPAFFLSVDGGKSFLVVLHYARTAAS